MDNNEILLTPAALLDFLRQVDELADKDISVDDTGSALNITIGDSSYSIEPPYHSRSHGIRPHSGQECPCP